MKPSPAADRSVRSVLCGGYKAVMLAAEAHAFERARARVEARGERLKDLADLVEARRVRAWMSRVRS